MADRYWVGGTGSWSSTNTANWAASSGGASGASVPTAADNVFFDAGSDSGGIFTVTMANSPRVCNDITISGLDFTMTLAGTSIGLTVSGSLSFPATNLTRTYTGTTTFNATTTGKTITTNGVAFGGSVTLNGVGGAWTLGSAFSCGTSTLTLTNGTFDTSVSNYAVTAGTFSSSNSNTRTINLNGSTITLSSSWTMTTSTNATVNAGTSTINLSGTSSAFSGGGLTYYNVSFTSTSQTSLTKSITGTNTFNNLTFATISGVNGGINEISLGDSQTINGTFTVNGSNSTTRQFIFSSTIGTVRTLTCASIAAMTDVDFRDITIAGAHGTLSGTRLGNCLGNSNITFNAGKTVYWNLAAGGNWTSTAWALSSGGAVAAANFPLPQDTAIIENTGLTAGNTIVIRVSSNVGTLDASARTNAVTFDSVFGYELIFYGALSFGSGVVTTGTGSYIFSNRSIQTVNVSTTLTMSVFIDAPAGGIRLLTNNLTVDATRTTTLTQGTLDLNNLTLTTGAFSSTNSNTRSIAFGTSGSIVLTHTTATTKVLNMAIATNFTFTGTSNISAAMSVTRTFEFGSTSGATTSNRLNINLTSGAAVPTFSGSFRQINFTGSTSNPGAQNISCHGFTLASGGTYTSTDFTTVGNGTLTYTGKAIDALLIDGSGITTTLAGAGQNAQLSLINGTLDLAGFTFTATSAVVTFTGTKNLTFNGGTVVCSAATSTAWYNNVPTGFTTTAGTGTGTISMTAATAKTFDGRGSVYNCTLNQGGAGTLTITGANTFNDIANTNATASQITFPASTTTTVNNFTLSGTAGNLVSIRSSTPGTRFTLSKSSGAVSVSYLDIQDSNATGGATWNAFTINGNVDSGNNLGWSFGGTTYAVSVSETATGEDAITLVLVRVGAVSETATGADTTASQLDAVGAVSETATGADQLTNIASLQLFLAETATGADTAATTLTRVGLVSETATGADTSSVTATITAYVDEGALYSQVTATLPIGTSFTGSTIFDNTSAGGGLAVVANGTGTGSSGGFAAGGNYILFSGANTRSVKTIPLNLTNCPSFNFSIIRGNGSNGGENPDTNENIVVEYSINGGGSYTTIATILNTDPITAFTTLSYSTPVGAQTSATIIRWRQSTSTQSNFDQYGIRNILFSGSVVAADAIASQLDTSGAVSETATGADTEAATLTRVGAVDETATGADTTAAQLDAFGGVDEAATAADNLATQLDGVANIDEIVTGVDSPLGNIITTLQIAEGATIVDEALARLLWELINDNQLPGWQLIQNPQGTGWTVINTNTGTSWNDIDTV